YDLELIIVSKAGNECWVRTIGYPVIEDGKVVAARGLFVDIHKSKSAQLKLEKKSKEIQSANRVIQLAQSVLGFGIWSYDIKKKLLNFDQEMFGLFKTPENQQDFLMWRSFIVKRDLIKLYRKVIGISKAPGRFEETVLVSLPEGVKRRLITKVESFENSNGAVEYILGTCTDVTEEYEMVNSLKESEKTINEAQQIANFGYFDYNITKNKLAWSDHMNAIFEPADDFSFNFESFTEVIHPDDKAYSVKQIQNSMQNGVPINLKHRIITRNSEIKTIYHQAKVFHDSSLKPYRIIGITQDITTERNLQDQLEENLHHQQLLTRVAMLLNNPKNIRGKLFKTLGCIGEALGVDGLFLLGNNKQDNYEVSWSKAPVAENAPSKFSFLEELDSSALIEGFPEMKIRLTDRSVKPDHALSALSDTDILYMSRIRINEKIDFFFGIEHRANNKRLKESEIYMLETTLLIISNVLKEKTAGETLRESEHKFKTLAGSITDPYIVIDYDYNYIYLNQKAHLLTDDPTASLLGRNISDHTIGPVDKDLIEELQEISAVAESRQIVREYKDKYLELSIYRGKIGYSIIMNDITDRFNLQRSLEVSKLKYQSLYHRTPSMMHSIDNEGVIINVSAYWLDKMGYSKEEVIGRNYKEFLTQASISHADNSFASLRNDKMLMNVGLQFKKKKGEVMEVLLSATTDINDNGEIERSLVVLTDISSEKKAEAEIKEMNRTLDNKVKERTKELLKISEELEERENFLNAFIQNSDSLIRINDEAGRFLLVNKKFARLHNYEKTKELEGIHFSKLYDDIRSEELSEIHDLILRNGQQITREEKLSIKDEDLTLLTTSFPLRKQGGLVYAIASISTDISTIKRQQMKLKEQSEELSISNQ
ncbi:MAG: PAS domain S-box protein, partial [Cyclobacteriaceae bacterium]